MSLSITDCLCLFFVSNIVLMLYLRDHAAGLNALIEADGVLVLGVLSPGEEVLLAREVGLIVDHERPALHPAGAASAQMRGDLRAVAHALIGAPLEVPPLEKDNLERERHTLGNYL